MSKAFPTRPGVNAAQILYKSTDTHIECLLLVNSQNKMVKGVASFFQEQCSSDAIWCCIGKASRILAHHIPRAKTPKLYKCRRHRRNQ